MKGNLALSLESVEVRMGQLAKDEITFQRSFSFDEIVRVDKQGDHAGLYEDMREDIRQKKIVGRVGRKAG